MIRSILLLFSIIAATSCGKVDTIAPFDLEKKLGASYSQVSERAKTVPDDIAYDVLYYPNEESLKDLVEYLIEGASSAEDKARVLHDWIAINVFYDYTHYDADLLPPYFPWEVLRRRQAVCAGFTALFFQMAKYAGLRVSAVTGHANNNHVWNAIYDGGVWNHIDVTWDAGSYQNGELAYTFSTTYFYRTEAFMSGISNHAQDGGNYTYNENYL